MMSLSGQVSMTSSLCPPEPSLNSAHRDEQACVPDFSGIPWRRVYCKPPAALKASWGMLSWKARGLYCLLITACDREGVIVLGRLGLMAVCGVIGAKRAEWSRIEPPLRELLTLDWLVYDDGGQRLALAWYRESQEARSLEAQRKQAYRERRTKAGDSPKRVPLRGGTVPADSSPRQDCPNTSPTGRNADRHTDAQR
jgi:hypothetical protein